MPAPPLSLLEAERSLREVERALREGYRPPGSTGNGLGAVAIAAQRLGMPAATLHNRLRSIKEQLGRVPDWALAAQQEQRPFTTPDLPPSHEPVEDLIQRRKAAFLRKRASADAKRWMRFEVHGTEPFALMFVGDPHADDDGCDLPTLERHLSLMGPEQRIFGVGMGDWTNNWIGRLQRLYAEQGTTASDAWRFAEWMLKRPGWLLLLRGNHDMWSGAGDPLRWIASGTPVVDWSAQFVVACGEASWKIEAAHDFPGSSMWNKLHAPMRRAKLGGQEADIYIAAHRHTFALAEEQDEHTGRVSWLARARGYKALDSYAHVSGFGQQQDRGQSIVAVCSPSDWRIRCFSDADDGADYLAWLRKPRVRVRAGAAA
jgi:hypothetical protein